MDEMMLAIAVITLIVTVLIPIALWWAENRNGERLRQLQESQASSLRILEQIQRQQRRDVLLSQARHVSEAGLLSTLWKEAATFPEPDRGILVAEFRANPHVALPGAQGAVDIDDVIDATSVHDYICGLESRYTEAFGEFDDLITFLDAVAWRVPLTEADVDRLRILVTGPCALAQRGGHRFYRELVLAVPAIAPRLIIGIGQVPAAEFGGIRLNILTGVLLAALDAKDRRVAPRSDLTLYRDSLANGLQIAIAYGHFDGFENWAMKHRIEPATTTIAYLIEVAGWLSDRDPYAVERLVVHLENAIRMVAKVEDRWWTERPAVATGFAAIARNRPDLWSKHGGTLESAADAVGPWRGTKK